MLSTDVHPHHMCGGKVRCRPASHLPHVKVCVCRLQVHIAHCKVQICSFSTHILFWKKYMKNPLQLHWHQVSEKQIHCCKSCDNAEISDVKQVADIVALCSTPCVQLSRNCKAPHTKISRRAECTLGVYTHTPRK